MLHMDITSQYRNQIDYIHCRRRWRISLQSAKISLGADCGSDHELLVAKFRLKLKEVGKTTRPFSSVQFSHSVMSNSLRPHGLQQARLPCPSPTPGSCSNSCASNWWCHPTISSSVVPFSSCLQSFPASGSFPMSQFLALGDQSIGASVSIAVLPMNIHDWFPLGHLGMI